MVHVLHDSLVTQQLEDFYALKAESSRFFLGWTVLPVSKMALLKSMVQE